MSCCCEPYQPLPISTGASGLDRCGNVVAYAAPSVVQAPVGWGCWPIQFQGWWLYQGPFPGTGGSGGFPWWGPPYPAPAPSSSPAVAPRGWEGALAGGAALAQWMIAQRGAQRGQRPGRAA